LIFSKSTDDWYPREEWILFRLQNTSILSIILKFDSFLVFYFDRWTSPFLRVQKNDSNFYFSLQFPFILILEMLLFAANKSLYCLLLQRTLRSNWNIQSTLLWLVRRWQLWRMISKWDCKFLKKILNYLSKFAISFRNHSPELSSPNESKKCWLNVPIRPKRSL
jgi:hypothetical protein